MKHTLALVTTVGLITFCIFNILHQQTKTVRSLPSDTLGTHKTAAPSKKKNVNVLDIYAKNMKNRLTKADRKIQLYKKPRMQQNFTAKSPLLSRILSKKLPISHISFSGKVSFFLRKE